MKRYDTDANKIFITIILITITALSYNLNAQQINFQGRKNVLDSLISETRKTEADSVKMRLYDKLAHEFSLKQIDSSLFYLRKELNLTIKIKNLIQEKQVLYDISTVNSRMGNFKGGLDDALKLLQLSEETHDTDYISDCYYSIANIYYRTKEYDKYLEYSIKCLNNLNIKYPEELLSGAYETIGDAFMNLGKLDSALSYFQKGYEIALIKKSPDDMFLAYENLGEINIKLSNYDLVIPYLEKATSFLPKVQGDKSRHYVELYLDFENLYEKLGKFDSALYYAQKAYFVAKEANRPIEILNSCRVLSTLYGDKKKIDSAYKYQSEMLIMKDSLFNEESIRALQIESADEIKRQSDLEEEKILENKERTKEIGIAGIALFIPTFFFIATLISKKKIDKRIIEFLAIISLLMCFEFITLVVHPFIENITKENPILTFIALVSIGLAIEPLHHKLERWTKSKLLKSEQKSIHPENK